MVWKDNYKSIIFDKNIVSGVWYSYNPYRRSLCSKTGNGILKMCEREQECINNAWILVEYRWRKTTKKSGLYRLMTG